MNEEIDIIELFKRIKEGEAPKEIEIGGKKYNFVEYCSDIYGMYKDSENLCYLISERIYFDTKIKILDKPIIEEIPLIEIKHDYSNGKTTDTYEVERAITNEELARKINEIIKYIIKEEKQ